MYSTKEVNLSATERKIVNEIIVFVNRNDSNKANWYVGIAADPRKRLFADHNVDEENGTWIYRDAQTNQSVRKIEKYLLSNYGFDGGDGGGSYSTRYLYAYIKAPYTVE